MGIQGKVTEGKPGSPAFSLSHRHLCRDPGSQLMTASSLQPSALPFGSVDQPLIFFDSVIDETLGSVGDRGKERTGLSPGDAGCFLSQQPPYGQGTPFWRRDFFSKMLQREGSSPEGH